VRLLLDTHVWLWWLGDDRRLGRRARQALGNPRSEVYVSAASAWEIAIKMSLGKLRVQKADLEAEIAANGFLELPIKTRHALEAGRLAPVHEDPFDRMLVAQARVEDLAVVSANPLFEGYGVSVLEA
jgi:PIN domain nuclease of toxin-antitoxin system